MTKRPVTLPDSTEATYRELVDGVRDRLVGGGDLGDAVQSILVDLNGDRDLYERWRAGSAVDTVDEVRLLNYHPDHAALESEWYAEKDEAAYTRSKALQWLWRQFDHTPLANNVAFGLAFRQMLAELLFADAGADLRIFRNVTMSYGHNISVGDNTVIHDGVHLDDRGRLTIGDRVSISEGAHLYSHDHDIVDQTAVTNYHTIVEDDARITFDSMVRAGVRIGENAMVGARAIVQTDVPAHHVVVGAPARTVRVKPGWEDVARDPDEELPSNRRDRIIEYELPADLERFDEFGRDLTAPDA